MRGLDIQRRDICALGFDHHATRNRGLRGPHKAGDRSSAISGNLIHPIHAQEST
jgi:hypothetical protein